MFGACAYQNRAFYGRSNTSHFLIASLVSEPARFRCTSASQSPSPLFPRYARLGKLNSLHVRNFTSVLGDNTLSVCQDSIYFIPSKWSRKLTKRHFLSNLVLSIFNLFDGI